jgi:small conductance mechanosensitive channel
MEEIQVEAYMAIIKQTILTYGMSIILAIILLIVGLKLSTFIARRFEKVLNKNQVEESLSKFLASLVSWVLKIAVFISTINTLGFETTSFIAILGSAGLAVGLAMQGSLSNFAGGVLILLLKPFKIGDFIVAQGESGTVESISTFCTTLLTPDNKVIIIPNGGLANSNITNVSAKPTRRVDFTFGIGYGDDLKKAKMLIETHFKSDARVLKDPNFQIVLGELADSSVNITARAWTKSEDYWNFYFETLEQIKATFDTEGISIPFPQRDVNLIK